MMKAKYLVCTLVGIIGAQGCVELEGPRAPTLVTVDSGGAPEANFYVDYAYSGFQPRGSRMSWSDNGASLHVAGIGPQFIYPTVESSLYSVATDLTVTRQFTLPTLDPFAGVACYRGATDCDLLFSSGRLMRRTAAGDTTTLFKSTYNGYVVSANGRFFLYAESSTSLFLYDATAKTKRAVTIPDGMLAISSFIRTPAVSDDGGEVDIATADLTVIRYNSTTGSSTVWTVPPEPGFTTGSAREIQWVGSTMYVLVRWTTDTDVRFDQYAPDLGTHVVLGTTKKPFSDRLMNVSWRPESQRLIAENLSACEVDLGFDPNVCIATQWELELIRGGTSTRLARSRGQGFLNLVLSPDGRVLAYGRDRVGIKFLPE